MNETHTGLLVNSRVFQETPMMLTGIQLLEDHKIVYKIKSVQMKLILK